MSDATPTPAAPPLVPHPPIAGFYDVLSDKRPFLTAIFDDTAADYDRVERWMSFGTGAWYRRQALLRAGLAPGMRVLDVATGTGLVAREALSIVGPAGSVVGVDPSAGMLRRAADALGIETVVSTAEALPFADASFDFVSMGYALRHVESIARTMAEFRRVLRPGGRLCVLEITRPTSALGRGLLRAYLGAVGGVMSRVVTLTERTPDLWRYYWETIEQCVPPQAVLDAITQAGFTGSGRLLKGIFSEYTATNPASPAPA